MVRIPRGRQPTHAKLSAACRTSSSPTSPTPTRAATCCSPTCRSRSAGAAHRLRRRQRRRQVDAPEDLRRGAASRSRATPTSARSPTCRRTWASGRGGRSVREMLLELAPPRLRAAGEKMLAAERQLAAGEDAPAPACGSARRWRLVGARRLRTRGPVGRRLPPHHAGRLRGLGARPATALSGGERKRLVLDVLFYVTPRCCCWTSPTTSSTCPPSCARAAHRGSRRRSCWSATTATCSRPRRRDPHARGQRLLVARRLLRDLPGGARAPAAAARRPAEQWRREERRLFRFYKPMKQRAAVSDGTPSAPTPRRRAGAASSTPARRPRPDDQQIMVRMPGAESARSWSGCGGRRSTGWCGRSTRRSTSASASA